MNDQNQPAHPQQLPDSAGQEIGALRERLRRLYADHQPQHIARAGLLLADHVEAIIEQFYAEILLIQETHVVLAHSLVHKGLKGHLRTWILAIVQADGEERLQALIERQQRIGKVHANVNVRLNQFMYAYGVLRRTIFRQLIAGGEPAERFGELFIVLGEIFDLLAALIAHAYFTYEFAHENNEFLLKFKSMQKSTAIECERLRSSLLDWLRTTLNLLYQTVNLRLDALPRLQHANFGLWVIYKADLLSPSNAVQQELQRQVEQIDHALIQAARYRVDGVDEAFLTAVIALNDAVSKTSWYLANLVDELIELDSGLDPLTRLFNRRYLETIMRRQSEIARRTGYPYAVLLFDIDHFKQVNDRYGHLAGDAVLKQFAELLLINIRTADFAFRYGGEEFLLVLSNASDAVALALGERIRQTCERFAFTISPNQVIQITCSAGVGVFDGHPDADRLLRRADELLYAAKRAGRNRVLIRSDS